MKPLRGLTLVLAVVLVCAQQAALAHRLWHALDDGKLSPQSQLCLQHGALDTVAGAVDAPPSLLTESAPVESAPSAISAAASPAPGLAPSSRGPPSLS